MNGRRQSLSIAGALVKMAWRGFVVARRSYPCTECRQKLDGEPTHPSGSDVLRQHHARCCNRRIASPACQLVEQARAQLAPDLRSPPRPRGR